MNNRPEILLQPNVPKPMHGLAPRTIMGQAWWDSVRKAAYLSTRYHCVACGVHRSSARYHNWLEAHEVYRIDYQIGRMTFEEVVPLCHACHNFIHSGRMNMMVANGTMEERKRLEIKAHGLAILQIAGLQRSAPPPPKKCAPWEAWRFVFNGQEYAPIHKNFEEWAAHYNIEI